MSLTTSEMTPADIAAVTGNNGGGMFGGDNGAWWIIVLFLFAGWGRNGFGGGGAGQVGGSACATQADLAAGFNNSAVLGGINDLKFGISDAVYALNNSITGGFHGVDNAICNLGYNLQSGLNGISREIGDCCCTTQRAIDGVNYNLATQSCETRNTIQNTTRDVIDNQNANARAILDALTAQRLADKDAKIAEQTQTIFGLQLAASQAAQNNYLIGQLKSPCPIPAYQVPNPNCCYGGCGG